MYRCLQLQCYAVYLCGRKGTAASLVSFSTVNPNNLFSCKALYLRSKGALFDSRPRHCSEVFRLCFSLAPSSKWKGTQEWL